MRQMLSTIYSLAITLIFLIISPRPALATWVTNTIYTPPINEYAQTPNMTLDSNNLGRVVYIQQDLSNPRIVYIQCNDRLCTDNVRVDTGISSGGRLSIIQGADNLSRIVHQNASYKLSLRTCTTDTCSTSTETLLGDTSNYGFTKMKYSADGYLRIAYDEQSLTYDLKYIQCQNDLCTAKVMTVIKTGYTTSFGFDLGTDGRAQFAYDDWDTARLYYAVCNTEDCTDRTTTILDTGDVLNEISPYAISLEVGTDNYARIAYILNDTLKFIRCTNQSCSTRNTTVITGVIPVGSTLLKLGSDDLPNISEVLSSESLNIISCLDQNCSSFSNDVVDSGPVNYQDDMNAIGFSLNASNFGYLAYSDQTDWKLHFATNAPEPTATPIPTPTSVPTATPTPTLGPPGPRPDGERSTTDTPTCNNSAPSHAPDLFQAVVRPQSATLYFSPVSGIHSYFLAFGRTPGSEEYGGELSYGDVSGVLAYQIEHLQPNSTYYVKLRGSNGCMPGDWSNILTITTPRSGSKLVYKDLASQVLSAFTNSSATASVPSTLGASTKSKKPSSCNYTVKPGDNLWDIASQLLGNGSLYQKIIQLNKLPNDQLNPGQRLKVC